MSTKARYRGGMNEGMDQTVSAPRVSTLGYALGVGASTMAIVGTVLHFAFPDTPDWPLFAGPFVLGAIMGAWRASAAKVRLSDA